MVTFSGVLAADGFMARHLVLSQVAWSKTPAVVTKPSKPEAARLVKVVLLFVLLFKVPQGFCVPSTIFTVYVAAQVPMVKSRAVRNRISFCFMIRIGIKLIIISSSMENLPALYNMKWYAHVHMHPSSWAKLVFFSIRRPFLHLKNC